MHTVVLKQGFGKWHWRQMTAILVFILSKGLDECTGAEDLPLP